AMRVSVVIPVRDGERYLMAALDSVLVQDPRPDEMIVVDDGSTDDTAALLTERSAPVRSVRQEPRGQAAALNRGIEESTGDVIGFCDADDLWAPGKQARQLAVLRSDPECDGVFGLVQQFVSDELDRAAGF